GGAGRAPHRAHQQPDRAPQAPQARPPQPSWSAPPRRPAPEPPRLPAEGRHRPVPPPHRAPRTASLTPYRLGPTPGPGRLLMSARDGGPQLNTTPAPADSCRSSVVATGRAPVAVPGTGSKAAPVGGRGPAGAP